MARLELTIPKIGSSPKNLNIRVETYSQGQRQPVLGHGQHVKAIDEISAIDFQLLKHSPKSLTEAALKEVRLKILGELDGCPVADFVAGWCVKWWDQAKRHLVGRCRLCAKCGRSMFFLGGVELLISLVLGSNDVILCQDSGEHDHMTPTRDLVQIE